MISKGRKIFRIVQGLVAGGIPDDSKSRILPGMDDHLMQLGGFLFEPDNDETFMVCAGAINESLKSEVTKGEFLLFFVYRNCKPAFYI